MRIIVTILAAIIALFLFVLLIANREMAFLTLDPVNRGDSGLALGPVPIGIHIGVGVFFGFVLGVIGMWLSGAERRRDLKDRRREVRRLRDELKEARQGVYRAPGTGQPAEATELVALTPTAANGAKDPAVSKANG